MFLLPSLAVCLVCLFGVVVLSAAAVGRRRRMMTPTMYGLLCLAVILAVLSVRSVLV
jgi:hypothetical protein